MEGMDVKNRLLISKSSWLLAFYLPVIIYKRLLRYKKFIEAKDYLYQRQHEGGHGDVRVVVLQHTLNANVNTFICF